MNPEQSRYEELYRLQSCGDYTSVYGRCNHGSWMASSINDGDNVLDIGCGHNQFIRSLRKRNISGWGIDFACSGADEIRDITQALPFDDNEFTWVTAFDMLEHLRPEQVELALREMVRVSNKFAFSICFKDSVFKIGDESLHPTVMNAASWSEEIRKFGEITDRNGGRFIGQWN